MRRRIDTRGREISAPLALLAIAAIVAFASLTACGPRETDPGALLDEQGAPRYSDGVYAAAFDATSPEGWRPYLEIRVAGGLVQAVCFDAVAPDGRLLSNDGRYQEEYRLATGRRLDDLLQTLEETFLETQSMPGPAAAGLADVPWVTYFTLLSRQVLQDAAAATHSAGSPTATPAGVAMTAPYRASDDPDELGWYGELVVIAGPGGPVGAHYDEYRRDAAGSVRVKGGIDVDQPQAGAGRTMDAAYGRRYAAAVGSPPARVHEDLVARYLGGEAEAVTGATLTVDRFSALAAAVAAMRVAAPVPRRLCGR